MSELYRDVSPGDITLTEIARSLDSDERETVASRMDGWSHSLRVSPSYAFLASGRDEDLYDAVQLNEGERERAEGILDRYEDPSNTFFSVSWGSTRDDILDMFERYEEPEDPFTVSKPELTLLNKMKAQARKELVEENPEPWARKLRTKTFPGIGEFQQIEDGAYKTVYAGPVDGVSENVVYAPSDTRRPGVFDDDFGESMLHTLAMQHNTERFREDGFTPASERLEPVVVDVLGRPYSVAVADYAEMEHVPADRVDEGKELASELEDRIKSEELYYHSTFNPMASQEFAKAGLRRDNIKWEEGRGLVIADPGEAGEATLEEVARVLGEDAVETVQ
ncbi:MAG: hypothetical protein ABEI58_01545, partial [Candidatus Nanohaloarchaea archaeon]